MTIHAELPWNVAGIAPEARDAARASARREGLSVGEWLTRRILRGLAETEPTTEDWWTPGSNPSRARETQDISNGRVDTFARVSHSEIESQESRRRIADQLNSLTQRVEHTVRDPTEHKHAVSNAAAEMTIAARDQAHAFDQLVARVARLDSRLAQIERRPPAENATERATIAALQEGLARLAVQVSQTASRSATQAAQLATAVEAVAGKFSQSHSGIQNLRQDFESRVSALAVSFGSIDEKVFKSTHEAEEQLRAVQERIAAAEKTIGRLETGQDSTARLDGSIEALTRRFETNEAEHFDSIARLESRVNEFEAGSGVGLIDKRLQGIEQALAGMANSIEKHAHEKADTSEAMQSELRNLASRIAASERRNEPIAKAPSAAGRDQETVAPPPEHRSHVPIFDPLPFAEKPPANFASPPAGPTMSPPSHNLRSPSHDDSAGKARPNAAQALGSAGADSFLTAGRRTARAANSSAAQQRNAPFSWVDPDGPQQIKEESNTRLVLLGGIGLLVLSAVGAGLYFSNNFSQTTEIPQTTIVAPQRAGVAARPRPRQIQPARPVPHLVSVPAPAAKTTPSAAAPKPAPFHLARESMAPAPAPRRMNAHADGAPPAQSASKPVTAQVRLAALANAGNAEAEEVLGLQYLDGDGVAVNEAEGAKWLERAAARGEAVAAYRLGTLYERGHGVPADQVRAARWYAAAAKAGNRKAMHNIAVAYAQGTGVQKNLALAVQWFLHAATAGVPDSQFNLAVLYERGMGVQQSLTQAYKWYAIAAAQGDPESKVRVEAMASQLSAADKAAAERAAADFQPSPGDKAANSAPIAASLIGG